MKMLLNKFNIVFMVVVSIFLSACVPSKMNRVNIIKEKSILLPTQGVIVARVINTSVYPVTFNFLTLAPKDVYSAVDNKFERLSALQTLGDSSTLFIAAVPVGEYSLSDIYSQHDFGSHYYSRFHNLDPSFGTFNIEAGKVTDLGSIIYYQKPDGDRYFPLATRQRSEYETFSLLNKKAKVYAAQLSSKERLTWVEDAGANDRRMLYLNMLKNPTSYGTEQPLGDGSWIFPSNLGVLLKRDNLGEWTIDAANTNNRLIYFHHKNKLFIAGDELGNIYYRQRQEKQWKAIPAFNTNEKLTYIEIGENNVIFAVKASKSRINVYKTKLDKPLIWTSVLTYTASSEWRAVDQLVEDVAETIVYEDYAMTKQVVGKSTIKLKKKTKYKSPKGKKVNQQFLYHDNHTFAAVNGILYEMDLNNAQATVIPLDISVSKLQQNAAKQLFASSDPDLLSGTVSTVLSFDAAKSWSSFTNHLDVCPNDIADNEGKCSKSSNIRKIQTFTHVSKPVFYEDGTAYSIMSKTKQDFGKSPPATHHMIHSLDDGQTWLPIVDAELPKSCMELLKGEKENILLLTCKFSNGYFYRTPKNNIQWAIEYQPGMF